jgi:hypothetical protein
MLMEIFYGYLTANQYKSNRTTIESLVALSDLSDDLTSLDGDRIVDAFCGR